MTPRFDVQPSIADMRFSPLKFQKFIIMHELAMVNTIRDPAVSGTSQPSMTASPATISNREPAMSAGLAKGTPRSVICRAIVGKTKQWVTATDNEQAAHEEPAGQDQSMGVD